MRGVKVLAHYFSSEQNDTLFSSVGKEKLKKDGVCQGRKVKPYDFKKALRFSQDQIRTLTRIHENCARLLTSYFSTQLRTLVQISVSDVAQYSYDEFIGKVEKNSILGVFKAPPLQGSMVMEISPKIAHVMLDRLLGGQGKVTRITNNLTEIEISVIQRIFIRALNSFQEAWSSVVKLAPELKEVEVNPQFLTMVPPNETVIVVSLNTMIGDVTGMINICLPHVVLEQVLPKLSARHWLATQKKKVESQELELLERKLKGTRLDVKAVLGNSTIEVSEFLNLKIDDVIRLDQPFDALIPVLVDDKRKFYAQPGVSKGKMSIQITDVLEEGDDFE
jgi:flagellar motor switch protein FliM